MGFVSPIDQQIAWQNSTFIFYMCIIMGTYILSLISKNNYYIKTVNKIYTVNIGFWISCFVLIIIKSLSLTGRDVQSGYYLDFSSATSLSSFRDNSIELGFRILMIIIKNIFGSYQFFIFIVGILTTLPILYLVWKYKNDIDVPSAFLIYSSIFYFTGFSAMRFALAASIAMLAFNSFYEFKYRKAVLYFILVGLIHISVLILAIPLLLIIFKKIDKPTIVIILVLIFLGTFFERNTITSLLSSSSRYYTYRSAETVGIGWEQVAYYVPLFIVYYLSKEIDSNKRWQRISFNVILTGFMFGMLSYVVPILGRLQYAFTPLILIIPYYIKRLKIRFSNSIVSSTVINCCVIAYCLLRFILFISQYYSDQLLMPYISIFGWSI